MRKILLAVLMCVTVREGAEGAAEFLELPASSRWAAMGQTGVAQAVSATALGANPAGLAAGGRSAMFSHGAYLDSSFLDNLFYAQPLGQNQGIGLGVRYFGYGSIETTDINGNPVGSLKPQDLAVLAGYGRTFSFGSLGVTGKYIRSELVTNATAFTADVGYRSPTLLNGKLDLGVAGVNLFGSLKYDQESSDLPRSWVAGGTYRVLKNWDASVQMSFPKGEDSALGIGTEYRMAAGKEWDFALRGGYSTLSKDVEGANGLSMGLGVGRGPLAIDYAFLPFGDVGSTHWITLGITF